MTNPEMTVWLRKFVTKPSLSSPAPNDVAVRTSAPEAHHVGEPGDATELAAVAVTPTARNMLVPNMQYTMAGGIYAYSPTWGGDSRHHGVAQRLGNEHDHDDQRGEKISGEGVLSRIGPRKGGEQPIKCYVDIHERNRRSSRRG